MCGIIRPRRHEPKEQNSKMICDDLVGHLLKSKTIERVDFTSCNLRVLFFTDGSIVCFEYGESSPQVKILYFTNHEEMLQYILIISNPKKRTLK